MQNYFDYNEITERMVIFTDAAPEPIRGKKLPIVGPKGWPQFLNRFDAKVNLETLDTIQPSDAEYAKSELPTLNDLQMRGIVLEWHPYKETSIYRAEEYRQDNGRLDVAAIQKAVKEKIGLDVSAAAIRHNYKAWRRGYKSGYRDEKNNVHVFTPCGGCNPFNVHVTELYPTTDWQTTYEC